MTFSSNLYKITAWATPPEILGEEEENRHRERWQTQRETEAGRDTQSGRVNRHSHRGCHRAHDWGEDGGQGRCNRGSPPFQFPKEEAPGPHRACSEAWG